MIKTRSVIRFIIVMVFILALFVSQMPAVRSDFTSFYAAATLARTEPARLYDQDLQFDIQARLGKSGYLPFAYPPVTALIFVPFSLLGYQSAYLAWLLLNLSLLLAGLYLLARRLALSSSQADALLVLTVLFLPVYIALIQGQLSIVVLLLFTLFVTEARGEWAGLWAGLLLIKPQLAFIPFLTLLLNRNWRGLAVGLATGLAQAVVSLALVGLPGLYDNLAVLRKMSTDNAVLAWLPRMHNLRQVSAFLGTGEAGYFVLAGIAVVVFSIAWLLNRDSSWSRIALVLVASLASPHLFLHDLTILLIPVAIFVGMQRQDFRYRHQLISAGSGLLSLLALYRYPIMSGLMLAGFMFGSSRLFSGSPSKQAGHSQVRRTGNEQAGCLRSPAEVPPSGH